MQGLPRAQSVAARPRCQAFSTSLSYNAEAPLFTLYAFIVFIKLAPFDLTSRSALLPPDETFPFKLFYALQFNYRYSVNAGENSGVHSPSDLSRNFLKLCCRQLTARLSPRGITDIFDLFLIHYVKIIR